MNFETESLNSHYRSILYAKSKMKYGIKCAIYYLKVWDITHNNLEFIPNINKRSSEHHIDHIIPISFGFKYGISERIIGNINNLRLITRCDNFRKNSLVCDLVKQKLRFFEIELSNLTLKNKMLNQKPVIKKKPIKAKKIKISDLYELV